MDYFICYYKKGTPEVIKFECWIECNKWKENFLLQNQRNDDCWIEYVFSGTCEFSDNKVTKYGKENEK